MALFSLVRTKLSLVEAFSDYTASFKRKGQIQLLSGISLDLGENRTNKLERDIVSYDSQNC